MKWSIVGRSSVAAIALLSAGCNGVGPGEGRVCTDIFIYGLNVQPKDSITGAGISSGASLLIVDGAFRDSVTATANRPDVDNFPLSSAGERAGTYQVTVRKPGYRTWTKSDVKVTRDECHVIPVSVTALLQPG